MAPYSPEQVLDAAYERLKAELSPQFPNFTTTPAEKIMRWNLSVPYADKDQVKSLGARWDAKQKVWYTKNPDTVNEFDKWNPQKETYAVNVRVMAVTRPSGGFVFLCDCTTPPWEECAHTEELAHREMMKIIGP